MTTTSTSHQGIGTGRRGVARVRLAALSAVLVPFGAILLSALTASAGDDQGCPSPSAEYLVIENPPTGSDRCVAYVSRQQVHAPVVASEREIVIVVQPPTGTTEAPSN